jgi:hypothetical protein
LANFETTTLAEKLGPPLKAGKPGRTSSGLRQWQM